MVIDLNETNFEPRAPTGTVECLGGTALGGQDALLRKAAHELRANASMIISVMQRALTKPCTPDQHELLRAARSSADSLLLLARKMKKEAGGA